MAVVSLNYLCLSINFLCLKENIRRCVCIIYDPLKSNQGVLALKALKLSDSFMDLYRTNNFTGEKYDIILFQCYYTNLYEWMETHFVICFVALG